MKWFLHVMVIILLLVFINVSSAVIIWVNPANTGTEDGLTKATGYKTLWTAITHMVSGDTIIIANGDWSGYSGMSIEYYPCPPSGTSGAYSKIYAETDWEVRLHHIYVDGASRSYIEIKGIVFDSRVNPISHVVYDWNHTKFIRCGFLQGKITGNNCNFGFGSADNTRTKNHHNLMEECIAWGGGRYVFQSKYGQYNIFRRCITRHDNQEGGYNPKDDGQIFNFRAYACDYHIYQNCISIDSDRIQYYNNGQLQVEAGGYWIGDSYGATGNEIHGCISIKDVHLPYYVCGSQGTGTSIVENSIALDVTVPGYTTLSAFITKSDINLNASNILGMTALGTGQDGFYGRNDGTFTITNSILKDVNEYGVLEVTNSYINHFNVGLGTFGEGTTTYDPELNGLLYPVRIEQGSTLATAGSGGTVCGPTILKKIGVSGTTYGEPGWDQVTDENLWPFPNEDKIKGLMSVTVEGVPGIYGFTAYNSPFGSPNTLTSYIWEYLGNKIPPEIYNKPGQPGKPIHVDK